MKKLFICITAAIVSLFIISCGTGVSKNRPEGWVNDNTFRVLGMGTPSDDITDKFRR